MSITKTDVLTRSLIVLWLAFSTGCANLSNKQGLPDEEQVRVRAQAWADALIANDLKGAYSFTSPNYRQYASAGRYNGLVAGRDSYISMVVESVTCGESVCDVRCLVEYEILRYGMKTQRLIDYKWVNVAGEWWLYVPPK
jgi:hypothetical protein